MSDRELPESLKSKLSAELEAGAPLRAPLPSQARYATAASMTADRDRGMGRRLATASVAALTLVLIGFIAVPPIVRTVGSRGHDLLTPSGASTPSPAELASVTPTPPASSPSHTSSPKPPAHETPSAHESPEPRESPEPSGSPEPSESPGATSSPGASPSPDQ